MSKLAWDQTGEKLYETGVDRGVLYLLGSNNTYDAGYAWNGLTAVNDSPEGAEATKLYADNKVYATMMSEEEYKGTIEAYTYPEQFEECDGSREVAPGVYAGQQNRKTFGFSYRSLIGNDSEGTDHGYKLHLVYGLLASPSERDHSTINDSPEAETMSWETTSTPVEVATMVNGKKLKPVSTLIIDSTKTDADKLAALEDILYGTAEAEPKLPLPDEVIALVGTTSADTTSSTESVSG